MGQRRWRALALLFSLPPLLLLPATPGDGADHPGHTDGPSQASPGPGLQSPSAEPTPGPTSPGSTTSTGPGPTSPAATRSTEPPPRLGPWPEPVRDVAKLCGCDLLVDQCDANCCCDSTCTAADFSLFTTCSIPVVTGDSQLCRQKEALYSIDAASYPPDRRFQVADKVNPSFFCIQTANYKPVLSFRSPEIPTSRNFDRLVQEFGGAAFGPETDLPSTVEAATQRAREASRYKYRDPIETSDGFLKLPAPLFGSQCASNSPSGFLVRQAVKCSRTVAPEECMTLAALGVQFYTNSSVLAVPKSNRTVNVTIQSVTVRTPEGLHTRLPSASAPLSPTLQNQTCSNVVLGASASYLISFTEAGNITGVNLSLILAAVNTGVLIQQSFAVRFVQALDPEASTRPFLCLNPSASTSGVVQSTNEDGQLTMLRSSAAQDCLAVEGVRTPVLFGYNMLSGCQLRVTGAASCELLAPALLNVLKGQNFPDCVAPFGNSPPQNDSGWVRIFHNVTKPSTCEIPVSLEMEVRWTKYGSLVNPQAKIASLTVTVLTAPLPQVDSASERTVQILTSVTFVDVSAPAEPGYRARPTIEAKLPYDFFFPFV
ncbi:hypothetical protein lerEdw1_003581 [Lerista edwardsae]|nr:hypothetical protein lerEdw1_003581 [Lerista edwardsae]